MKMNAHPLLLLLAVLAGLTVSEARLGAVSRISGKGRWLVDSFGRVRIFHGFNDVQEAKGSGHTPGGTHYLPRTLMNDTNVAVLEEGGFNAFRVPMMWSGVNPAPGEYDAAYMATIKGVVQALGKRGMWSFLDMHQDVLSSLLGSYDGAPRWVVNQTKPRHAYPWPLHLPLKAWGYGYLTEATGQSFQEIYDDTHGGLTAWAGMWRAVAKSFRDEEAVLGYELINEPWPGDVYRDPLLLLPGDAGKHLMRAYDRVVGELRKEDNVTMVMFEPVTWGMVLPGGSVVGSGFKAPPLGPEWADRSILSWHYYCWFLGESGGQGPYKPITRASCHKGLEPLVFSSVGKDERELGVPSFLTEFGGVTPDASKPDSAGTEEILAVLDEADKTFTSWTYWDILALVTPNGFNMDKLSPFVRPYAQAVAGMPEMMRYDNATRVFTLQYRPDASITAPTEVIVPRLVYPAGYSVSAEGASWSLCPQTTAVLCFTPSSHPPSPTLTVTVSPK